MCIRDSHHTVDMPVNILWISRLPFPPTLDVFISLLPAQSMKMSAYDTYLGKYRLQKHIFLVCHATPFEEIIISKRNNL